MNCYGLNCVPHFPPPPNSYVKAPVLQNVTLFRDSVLTKVGNQVKMWSLGGALTQHDWCSFKKKFGHKHV